VTGEFVTTVISPDVAAMNSLYESYAGHKPSEDYPSMSESDVAVMVASALLFQQKKVEA